MKSLSTSPDTVSASDIDADPSALEASTIRKAFRRIVPFIIALYFLSFLNRVNVGFAGLTMNHDIGLTPAMFGIGAGIFFAGYILCGMPSNLALQKVGARRWIALLMVVWGFISAATAFSVGPYSFYGLRFALGLAEAGFFPGIILYLSYWFPSRHRAFVTAIFMAAAPLSNMIGSPISAAIGMLLAGHASTAVLLIVGLSIANFGVNAAKPPLWSMPTQFLSGSAAAAGIAIINAMGSLIGGTFGPMIIGKLRGMSGDFSLGLYFVSATMLLAAIIAYFLRSGSKTSESNTLTSI